MIIIGIFAIYVAFRVASLAIAKSWKQVMTSNQCDKCENGNKHRHNERRTDEK